MSGPQIQLVSQQLLGIKVFGNDWCSFVYWPTLWDRNGQIEMATQWLIMSNEVANSIQGKYVVLDP
jgi:hypothetical protein